MQELYENVRKSLKHLDVLHSIFSNRANYSAQQRNEFDLYKENYDGLVESYSGVGLPKQLYSDNIRQWILADIIEYIFLGRGFLSMGRKRGNSKEKYLFIKTVLRFTNMLMCYESITVNSRRRNKFLKALGAEIPQVKKEQYFRELLRFTQPIGLPESKAPKYLSTYFDKLLPKTAGGLWHELLVYTFLLREDLGYILPLLLHQKIYSLSDHLVPPDFLIISHDKRIYGIEVGIKKEIQSGSFSLRTAVPTATIDTINSRNSDRCPQCREWILFCPHVINNYSNPEFKIESVKVNCLKECSIYDDKKEIAKGVCKYSKYSRKRAKSLPHTHNDFADGMHYHYQCVLKNVDVDLKTEIIEAHDQVAIITHYPNYSGLEELR